MVYMERNRGAKDMRTRMIKVGERNRVMIRTNSSDVMCRLAAAAKEEGLVEVGFLKFWMHVAFGAKKKKQPK
jgi:hypothetical protein|tara:strand:- start:310 stop:525 length:216 start_codon:yes stop_codon:yes gene_type:complete